MKNLVFLGLTLSLFLTSCGGKKVETKISEFDVSYTAEESTTKATFTELGYDGQIARNDFRVGKRRVNLIEIEKSIYPDNLEMLKTSLEGKEIIETKSFENKSFGAVFYKKEGVKFYRFYFSKGNRYFLVEPVFNNDLKDLDAQLEMIKSLK